MWPKLPESLRDIFDAVFFLTGLAFWIAIFAPLVIKVAIGLSDFLGVQ